MSAPTRRHLLTGLAAATICLSRGRSADAAAPEASRVLMMFEEPGCPYCARWKREVEVPYRNSPEGAFAPLAFRDIGGEDAKKIGRIVYSPTFVLVDGGKEVGRIVGYTGADFFWGEIEILFRRAGYAAQ